MPLKLIKYALTLAPILLIIGCGADTYPSEPPEQITYTIQVSTSDPEFGQINGEGSYNENDIVLVTAIPNEGYQFNNWTIQDVEVSTNSEFNFQATGSVDLIAHFEKIFTCADSLGGEMEFTYSWSLETEQITFTNNNECDSLFIWATSTPLCDGCTNTIISVKDKLIPGQSIVMSAGVPLYLSWKPEVIYTLANGDTYAFHPKQAGTGRDIFTKIILLDNSTLHTSQIEGFQSMFAIDANETVRGDCFSFSWLDRDEGRYQIAPTETEGPGYCFVGNITGYTDSGDAEWLPHLQYFVTHK